MTDMVLLNQAPAPYRRDLRGDDLCYELELLLDRLQPGDTLSIDEHALVYAGARITRIKPPSYSYTIWTGFDMRWYLRRNA